MKIALIGYGKMGKTIEAIALSRHHQIVLQVNADDQNNLLEKLRATSPDVAIEFSRPEAALQNLQICFEANVPVVCGTTGWLEHLEAAKADCARHKSAFFYASNFSIGVNLFFIINKKLAELMNYYPEYQVKIEETHHIQKLDAPSGTAISLAKSIMEFYPNIEGWTKDDSEPRHKLPIISHRIDDVPGTHAVTYSSEIDTIEIKHTAHSRDGFALGAVLAAEWLRGKYGFFEMKDFLEL